MGINMRVSVELSVSSLELLLDVSECGRRLEG